MPNDPGLRIGALAEATDTRVVTIRYYEKIGLLPTPRRTAGNYRVYRVEHLDRLRFIRRCRDLGFTLEQVRDLLRLSGEEDRDCGEVDRIAADHLRTVERKLGDLQSLAQELQRILTRCRGGGRIRDCRVIEALSPKPGR